MPTKKQMDAAVHQLRCLDDRIVAEVIEGRHPEIADRVNTDTSGDWANILGRFIEQELLKRVDWQGFTEGQRTDVVRRVVDCESRDRWMDGIEPTAAPDLAEEQ